MREEFYKIYKDLYEDYGQAHFRWFDYYHYLFQGHPNLKDLKDLITETINELKLSEQVSPDAKFLLLINFHYLVILPLKHPDSPYKDMKELSGYIKNDLKLILRTAKKKMAIQKKEVSSGDILKAIGKVWDNLDVNKLEIWG